MTSRSGLCYQCEVVGQEVKSGNPPLFPTRGRGFSEKWTAFKREPPQDLPRNSQGAHSQSAYLSEHHAVYFSQVDNEGFGTKLGKGDMKMSTKKKVAAIVITTVALTAGTVGVSSAASKTTKATRVSVTKAATVSVKGPRAEVASVLAALVTQGTITQAQADAITAALAAAETAARANAPQMGPKGPMGADLAARMALITSTLGIDEATIKSRLAAGETLAAIAGSKTDALISALVAEMTKQIDAAVAAGKLTAAQATTMKAGLTANVTKEVNESRQAGPKGERMERRGPGGKGGAMGGPKGGPAGSPTMTLPATPTA